MSNTRGVLYVHSAPSALRPHIEWAVGGVFAEPVRLEWQAQPAEPGMHRCEHAWEGAVGVGAAVVSALRGWDHLRFELTEEPTATTDGHRWMSTPSLGVFCGQVGHSGDIVVPEERLRWAMAEDDPGAALLDLMGDPWDAELEVFRWAGEGAPVRWLHRAV
ncbi:Protein of unknown function [Raineyella antarctica]|uniref:DUF3145 domain-containing protein n=1 Tax=Raineyella antarctica TaxID=1577474 RepID=A0A1G6GW31_9ACTN|nr:DUF3145 family protein [Raineyella antarctica]SDB86260.1 Protein of unknown function [Raineyella antarctica]